MIIFTAIKKLRKESYSFRKSSNSRNYIDKYFAKHGILLNPEMELGAHHSTLRIYSCQFRNACVVKEFLP